MRVFNVAAAALCVLSVARGAVVGVAPEDGSYAEGAAFKCKDGSGEVPFAAVNDDYCDCADGSDEPGTSACAGLSPSPTFWCANEGHKGAYVLQSRINDGICDCCDGTDEYATDAGCANNCVEVATVLEKEKREKEVRRQAGLAKKVEYIARAKEILASRQAEAAEWQAKHDSLTPSLQSAEVVKTTEEAIEQSERDAVRVASEAKQVEHNKALEGRRAERAVRDANIRAKVDEAVAAHGALVEGGQVVFARAVKFLRGVQVPEGTKGAVVGFEGGAVGVEDEDEEPVPVLDGDGEAAGDVAAAAEAASPRRPVISVEGFGFTFLADPLDVLPAAPQDAAAAAAAKAAADAKAAAEAAAGAAATAALAEPAKECVGYSQTGNCDPEAGEELRRDCTERVFRGISGVCECSGGRVYKFTCDHEDFTCQHVCEHEGAVGTELTHPCPKEYPYAAAAGTEVARNVCYKEAALAEAGSGPCGTWCSRDASWYATNQCTWGCDCGRACGSADTPADAAPAASHESKEDEDREEPFVVDTGSSYIRTEAQEARTAYDTLKSEADELKRKIDEATASGEVNYGPENEFLPLKDECFEYPTPEYTYKLCPFKDVHQGHTSLGAWASWGKQSYGAWGGSDDLSVMKFDNVCHSLMPPTHTHPRYTGRDVLERSCALVRSPRRLRPGEQGVEGRRAVYVRVHHAVGDPRCLRV